MGKECLRCVVGGDARRHEETRAASGGKQPEFEFREHGERVDVADAAERIAAALPHELAGSLRFAECVAPFGPERRVRRRQGGDEFLAGGGVGRAGDLGGPRREKLLLLKFHAFPHGISQDAVESAGPAIRVRGFGGRCTKNVGELEVPMKKLVLLGEPLDLFKHPGGERVRVGLDCPKDFLGDGKIELRRFLPDERRTPGVGQEPAGFVVARCHERFVVPLLRRHLVERVVGQGRQGRIHAREVAQLERRGEEGLLLVLGVFPFLLVGLLEPGAELFVVALDRFKSRVGDARGKECGRGPKEAVADLDVVVEERKRLARLHRFKPEVHAAELRRHRIQIDAVEAVADAVAKGRAIGLRARLHVARAHGRQPLGQAMRGANQKMPAAHRRVADLECEQGLLRVGAPFAGEAVGEERLEGRVEAHLHERIGRVVGA